MVKTILKIDGMMCGMCEAHINDCIRRAFDVKKSYLFPHKTRNHDSFGTRAGSVRAQTSR